MGKEMNSPAKDNPCPACTLPCDARTIDGESGCTTPTTDENRFVGEDGTVYIAVDAGKNIEPHSCDICEHPIKRNCVKSCIPEFRKDRRNIVWKRLTKE